MSAYTDARDAVFAVLMQCSREFSRGVYSATPFAKAQTALAGLEPVEQTAVARAFDTWLEGTRSTVARFQGILEPKLSELGRAIASPGVSGGTVVDSARLFDDWRAYMDGTPDERVEARGFLRGSDPADSTHGALRRLLVDHRGRAIERGFDGVQTLKVTGHPVAGIADGVIFTEDGPLDSLDYLTAPAAQVAIAQVGALSNATLLTNPTFRGNADTADNAVVTAMSGWTLSKASATVLIDTVRVWPGTTYSHSFAGAGQTVLISQPLSVQVINAGLATPVMVPVYKRTGWEGNVIIRMGGQTFTFAHGVMTADGWTLLVVPMNANIYPQVYDASAAVWSLTIEIGAGASTNEIIVGGFFPNIGVEYQGVRWYWWSGASQATINSTVTIEDKIVPQGVENDMLAAIYNEYLPNAGTNLVGAAALAGEVAAYNQATLAAILDGASIPLGTVPTGAHEFEFILKNVGVYPVALTPPEINDTGTNATMTELDDHLGNSVTTPFTLEPGEVKRLVVEITDGGAGAFSYEMVFTDSRAGTFSIEVAGTAS